MFSPLACDRGPCHAMGLQTTHSTPMHREAVVKVLQCNARETTRIPVSSMSRVGALHVHVKCPCTAARWKFVEAAGKHLRAAVFYSSFLITTNHSSYHTHIPKPEPLLDTRPLSPVTSKALILWRHTNVSIAAAATAATQGNFGPSKRCLLWLVRFLPSLPHHCHHPPPSPRSR